MAKETKWIDILITEDGVKGSILGLHSFTFEKNKNYRINMELAKIFFDMNVAAVQSKPPEGGALVLHIHGDKKEWRQEISE